MVRINGGRKGIRWWCFWRGSWSSCGAVIGKSSEKKFLINGEWESLQEMKASLQK
jgi:hypothetical protein